MNERIPTFLAACFLPFLACVGDDPASAPQGGSSGSSGAAGDGAAASTASGGGASSGDAPSSSSGDLSTSSSGQLCPAALEPTIFGEANLCGALPITGQPIPMNAADGGTGTYAGGIIRAGQYELVGAIGVGEGTWQSVLVFADEGARRTQNQKISVEGAVATAHESGTWSTSANALTLSTACSSDAAGPIGDRVENYAVREDGCEVYLDIGDASQRLTFRRRHE